MASKPSGSRPGKKPPKGSGTPTTPKKADPAASPGSTASSGSSSPVGRPAAEPPTETNPAGLARALFGGFITLVFGGLLQPAATKFLPAALSPFWIIAVGVVGFSVAGLWAGAVAPKAVQWGAGIAVCSYLMTVPLLFLNATFDPVYAVYTVVAAVVIGALTGKVGFPVMNRLGLLSFVDSNRTR